VQLRALSVKMGTSWPMPLSVINVGKTAKSAHQATNAHHAIKAFCMTHTPTNASTLLIKAAHSTFQRILLFVALPIV